MPRMSAYACQVLSVANPEAFRAITGENPPLHLYSIEGIWPDDPWTRALPDMRGVAAPGGNQWTDTSRYDLAGWQGSELRARETGSL